MSNRRCRPSKTGAALLLAVLVTTLACDALAEKPEKPPREAVTVTRSTYKIIQADQEKGTEEIVRTDFNDNTVVFEVLNTLHSSPEVTMEQNAVLTVVDESFFPLEYRSKKTITHSDGAVEIGIDAEMFANVAVYTTRSASRSGSRNIVLPTGSVFIETGVVYVYYQLLFAYNHELGGRQSFNTFNVDSGKKSSVVVQLLARDTVAVAETEYEVDIYKIQREQFDITLFVDDDGRIVRVEQNFMTFDLVDWSSSPPAE
jgi:hypothetical protein